MTQTVPKEWTATAMGVMNEHAHIGGTNKLLATSRGSTMGVGGIDAKGFTSKEASLTAGCE